MTDPRRALPWLRRATLLALALGIVHLVWRFEALRLPADGCSPLQRLSPGNLMLLDTRAATYGSGDVVLFAAADPSEPGSGVELHVAEVVRVDPTPDGPRYWVVTDVPDCPGLDSEQVHES